MIFKTDFSYRDQRSARRYIQTDMPPHRLWCAIAYRRHKTTVPPPSTDGLHDEDAHQDACGDRAIAYL